MSHAIEKMGEEFSWETLFDWKDTPYHGYVSNINDADDIVQEFSYETSTSYCVTRTSKEFGSFAGKLISKHLIIFNRAICNAILNMMTLLL